MEKSERVRKFMAEGDWKSALGLAKGFKLGITKSQHSDIARAYECIVFPQFYKSIGKNLEECINKGIETLKNVM